MSSRTRNITLGIVVVALASGAIIFGLRADPADPVARAPDPGLATTADASPLLVAADASVPTPAAPVVVATPVDAGVVAPVRDAAPSAKRKPAKKTPEAWVLLEKNVLGRWFSPAQIAPASQVLQDMCATMLNLLQDFAEREANMITDGGVGSPPEVLESVWTERFETEQDAIRELAKLSGGKFSFKQMKELAGELDFGRACPNVGEKRDEPDDE